MGSRNIGNAAVGEPSLTGAWLSADPDDLVGVGASVMASKAPPDPGRETSGAYD